MKRIINKIAPASIAALTILGLTAPGASAQVTRRMNHRKLTRPTKSHLRMIAPASNSKFQETLKSKSTRMTQPE